MIRESKQVKLLSILKKTNETFYMVSREPFITESNSLIIYLTKTKKVIIIDKIM